jgi:hypothetical protein
MAQNQTEMIVITPTLKWFMGIVAALAIGGIGFVAKTVYNTAQDTAIIKVELVKGYATKEELNTLKDRVLILETRVSPTPARP